MASHYDTLSSTRREIRLLRFAVLHRSSDDILFAAQSENTSLDDTNVRAYTALSYEWGDASDTRSIYFNGELFTIRARLYEFLRRTFTAAAYEHLREDLFWIDAISINQGDETEKQVQLGFMRDVYGRAAKTILWLGPSLPIDYLAFPWLMKLADYEEGWYNRPQQERDSVWNDAAWLALSNLLERSYFRRRWIIQETIVSPHALILNGESSLTWDQFYKGVIVACRPLYLEKNKQGAVLRLTDDQTVSSIGQYRDARSGSSGGRQDPSMWELLTGFRRQDSTEPHDRIFALLGLCRADEAAMYAIDYSLPLEETFMQVVINHIRLHGNLDILSACCQAVRIQRKNETYTDTASGMDIFPDPAGLPKSIYLPNLPTWTPNWTSQHTWWILGPLSYTSSHGYSPMFRASGALGPSIENLNTAIQDRILRIAAREVDIISYIHPGTARQPPPSGPIDHIFASLWMRFSSTPLEGSPYTTHNARLTAFVRTLTTGGVVAGTRHLASDCYVRYTCATLFARTTGPLSRLHGPFTQEDYKRPAPHECFENHHDWTRDYPEIEYPIVNLEHLAHFRFFISRRGRLGLCRPGTRVGHRVCIVRGASSPIILQQSEDVRRRGGWNVMGEAYVHGLMFGEGLHLGQDAFWGLV